MAASFLVFGCFARSTCWLTRIDFLEGRAQVYEIFLVDLQLEIEFREVATEHVFALPEFRRTFFFSRLAFRVLKFLPRFSRRLTRIPDVFSTSFAGL